MSQITLDRVTKVYPNGVRAVDDVELEIRDGEFVVLVGPSGCGKSTLLRMIAGLEDVTEGAISIGDVDVTDQPPQQRDIAMVFQNYALYPHMTVRENLAYGLQAPQAAEGRVEAQGRARSAKTLGLDELLDRKPSALSGGQRQRVAMGRAIVREPKAFLMDEPLSNLDAKLRVSMRAELARLHDRLGVTTVYVTHDQVEAMTLGERVAVLRDGVLQQVDTPQNLFHHPTNLFVAAFIGSPSMNLIDAEISNGRVSFAGLGFDLPASSPGGRRTQGRLILGRPSDRLRARRDGRARVAASHGEARRRRGSRLRASRRSSRSTRRASPRRPCAPPRTKATTRASSSPRTAAVFTAVRRRAAARRRRHRGRARRRQHERLHFFDPGTGLAIDEASRATVAV